MHQRYIATVRVVIEATSEADASDGINEILRNRESAFGEGGGFDWEFIDGPHATVSVNDDTAEAKAS